MKKIGGLAVLLIFLPLTFIGASAPSREDAMSAVLRCAAITDDSTRLACYDKAAGQTRSALASPEITPAPAPATMPAPAPQQAATSAAPDSDSDMDDAGHWLDRTLGTVPERAVQTSVAQFGSETLTSKFPQPIHIPGDTVNAVHAQMTRYTFAGGLITVWLDNGQVWRQVLGDEPVGYLSEPAASYAVEIRRGGAGAYVMSLSGLHRKISVLRIG
ncbi:MAG TPA: hypothetical protein VIJ72_06445 [Rhizomicrobium sp.]